MAIDAAQLRVVVSADTSKAESGLKNFSSSMKSAAGSMASVGGVLSATIGAPLIAIGVSAVQTAATFEKSMNVLGFVTGATGDQMQAMSDQALQLGADTVFSANEAADGMVELAKAGLDTQQVMEAIPGVMDLAAAGAISVADAATLAAATVNTFGLNASDTTKVADVLAAAANASAADISDLAFGVQNAGTVFASSGQSVETLATMMALLANNGLNASDAATSLKTMTLRLTAPTAQAAKEMKRLGINVFDAEGNMRDYHDIIGDLQGATLGLSDAQRAAAFNTIFGADAIRAASIFAKEGTAGYEAMNTAVKQQGASADMAAAQNSGLSGAMEQISGSLDSLKTKLALPFLDTIAGWLGQLTELINKLGELPQPVINATLAFAGFAIALGAILLVGAGVAATIGTLSAAFLGADAAAAGISLWPVVLAVLALAAAAATLSAAWETNWGDIQGKTEDALGAINPLLDTLKTNLNNAAGEVATAATNIAVLLAFNPKWQTLVGYVQSVATAFGDLATDPATFTTNVAALLALNPKWQEFVQNAKDAQSAVSGFGASLAVGAASFAILLALNPQWQGFIDNVKSAASAASTLATNLASAVLNFKMPDIGKAAQTLKSNVEFQVNATVKTLLKPPVLTVAPFPAMTIPPPPVTITPLQAVTVAVGTAVLKPDKPPPAFADVPGKMIDNLTAKINGADWGGVGDLLGTIVVAKWNAEIAKIGPLLTFGGMLSAFGAAWSGFQTNFIGSLLSFSLAVGATGLPAKIFALGESIATAVETMWTRLITRIMNSIMQPPPDATSTSDILRERALGAEFKWPELPEFKWPELPEFKWPDAIFSFKWPDSLAFDWGTWLEKLNWSEWISGVFHWSDWISGKLDWSNWITGVLNLSNLGGGGGGGSTGGTLQGPRVLPGENQPTIPNRVRPSAVVAGAAWNSPQIVIREVHVHNEMDIEVLAAQLARRFQQKLR